MSYETVSIRSGHWYAEIAPAYGANPIVLRHGERDILVPWSEAITDPFLAGAPLLLPANRTAGGRFCFNGREYTLGINNAFSNAQLHGKLYCQTFLVIQQEADRVVLEFENRGEIYPFPFRITVTYRAGMQGFTAEYTIENPADSPMPLTFGLHTTFAEPEWFSVPLAACQEKDSRHIPTGRYIPLNPQEQQYCTGSPSRNVIISGFYLASGNTARIGSDVYYEATGFDHWVLYNGRGEGGFLCIEPQLGGVNALNDPFHCPVISGNSTLIVKTRIFLQS